MDTDTDRKVLELAARAGADAGKAAASWYEVTDENAGAILRGLADADPAVLDTLPSADLSGQWADEPTGPDVVRDVLDDAGIEHSAPGDNHAPGTCERCDWYDGLSDILDAYQDAYSEAASAEVERRARYHYSGPHVVGSITCDCGDMSRHTPSITSIAP